MAERDPVITGARIARRRHQIDMTQVELAEALGVSPSTVANWERGVSYPSRKIGKIEQLLGPLDEPAPAGKVDQAEAAAAEIIADAMRWRAERERREGAGQQKDDEDDEPARRASR